MIRLRAGKRKIKSGKQFNSLFPKSKGDFITIKKTAFLKDTLELMPKVINETLQDTAALAPLLKGDTIKQTCRNIWNFCFQHLQYTRDEAGKEQVRRPARSWKDRKSGVDCDCMTVFIASILTNLSIPYTIRLTKDKSPDFEHVYPVVKTPSETIILDAVVHEFNREAPYREKKDIDMELQYLNGIGDDDFDYDENDELIFGYEDEFEEEELDEDFGSNMLELFDNDYPDDAQQLIVDDELDGLEGKAERRKRKAARKSRRKAKRTERRKIPLGKRIKRGLKKGLHALNRLNPATMLLRGGVLASMKLNVGKVARKLRFSYWSPEIAQKNNMEMNKFRQLVKVREKLEKIFYGAGGKAKNLKKAILTGKGNRDRKVQLNGLGSVIDVVEDHDDLLTILGEDLYSDELSDDTIDGLGAVATGAAVASASGVIATISALLKKIGGLFKKGSLQAKAQAVAEAADDVAEQTRKFSLKNLAKRQQEELPSSGKQLYPITSKGMRSHITPYRNSGFPSSHLMDQPPRLPSQEPPSSTVPDTSTATPPPPSPDADDTEDEPKGIIEWIKANPVKTGLIGLGTAGLIGLGVWAMKKNKAKPVNGLEGVKTKKRKAKKRRASPQRKAKTTSAKRKTTRKRSNRSTTARRKSTGSSGRRTKMVELK